MVCVQQAGNERESGGGEDGGIAELDDSVRCAAVDIAHHLHLAALLGGVILVDADGVGPDAAWRAPGSSEMLESGV